MAQQEYIMKEKPYNCVQDIIILCKDAIKGRNYAVICHGNILPYTYPCGLILTLKISANKPSVFCTKLKLELKLNYRNIYSFLPE